MDNLKFYLFYTILTRVTTLFSTSYLYAEHNQTFQNTKNISINISFRDFGRFILYAVDSEGCRLLITYSNKQININFNGKLVKETVIYHPNSINNFKVDLKFVNNNFHFGSSYFKTDFGYKFLYPDPFQGYPFPKNYRNEKNKTYFWIGNIGPHVGEMKKRYEPVKNPTFGCLHYLYIDSIVLNFQMIGNDFSKSCERTFKQIDCIKENCSETIVKENFIDCSVHAGNTNEKCYFDLIEYDGQERSFERIYGFKLPIFLKFIWKQKISKQFCLIEIIFKNGISLLFYTNERNQLEMCFSRHLSEKCNTKILFNTTLNDTHVLLITFEYPHIFIKISNGKYIRNIIEPFLGHIKNFVIGFRNQVNICGKFEGKLAFRYDVSQFRSVCSQRTMFEFFKIHILLFGGFLVAVIVIVIFCFTFLKSKCARNQDKLEIQEINTYDPIQVENIELRDFSVKHDSEPSVYEIAP